MAENTTAVPKPQVEPEPQNELTKKFTDKEWAAIKEFRVRISTERQPNDAQLTIYFASTDCLASPAGRGIPRGIRC